MDKEENKKENIAPEKTVDASINNETEISAQKNKEQEEEIIDQEKLKILIKNDLIGGYSLAVRDNWGFKILRRHITDREKELFIQRFGEKLVKDDEFFHWWCAINEVDDKEYNLELPPDNSDLYEF